MSFNPNATAVLGLEWPATTNGSFALDAASKIAAAKFTSSTAETIDQLEVWLSNYTGSPKIHVEVYESGSEVAANKTTTRYLPGTDTGKTTTSWEDQSAGAVNYTDVDEDDPDGSTYAKPTTLGGQDIKFRGNATALADKRIVSVSLGIAWSSVSGNANSGSARLNIDSVNYDGPIVALGAGGGHGLILIADNLATWTLNPATGVPWTLADINDLVSTGATDEFGFDINFMWTTDFRLYGMWLDVTYVDENRVAYGTFTGTAPAWNAVSLEEPDGTDNWPKAGSSQDYTVTLRRVSTSGSAAWRTIDSGAACPNAGHASYQPTTDGDGLITALGSELTAAHALVAVTSGAADSVDSQPYANLQSASVVSGGTAHQQEVSGAAAETYNVLSAVVRAPTGVDDDLLIKLHKRSDDSQLCGTFTVDKDEVGTAFERVIAKVTNGTLAGSTQYYLAFTTDSSVAWNVAYLDSRGNANGVGYGGTTDRATVAGTDDDNSDFPAFVGQAPDAPADFAVALAGDPNYAAVTWTATSPSGAFVRYEIQRKDANDTTWRQIAAITTEAVEEFDDYEGRRAVQSDYRMRVVDTNGIISDWTSTDWVNPAAPEKGWWFTSNETPSLNVNLRTRSDTRAEQSFTFPHERQAYRILGRDNHVVLSGTEDRGDVFTYNGKLTAGAGGQTRRAAFDDMLALSKAVLSYVCVLDPLGRRWFASITVPEGSHHGRARLYEIPVEVVEVTDTPSTPDVTP